MSSIVYFIYTPDRQYIKIGCTKNLAQRLIQLGFDWRFRWNMQGSKMEYQLIGFIEGERDVEKAIHLRFAKYRPGKSEEFEIEPELIDWILRNAIPAPNQMELPFWQQAA